MRWHPDFFLSSVFSCQKRVRETSSRWIGASGRNCSSENCSGWIG
jgi:hypothetical protein